LKPLFYMRKYIKKYNLSVVLVTITAFLFVVGGVFAATTIGSNITTGGTLDVTGVSTFTRATSTSATTTAYFYAGPTFTLSDTFDYAGGDAAIAGELVVGGNVAIGAVASATDHIIIGNSSGSDDDALYFDIGLVESFVWDDDPGEFDLSDDLHITGSASTTGTFVTTGRMTVATTSATTTNELIVGAPAGNSTTTISVGSDTGTRGACIEMWQELTAYRIHIDGAGTGLVVEAGRCKE
jgi:hypothetical protein